MKEKKEKILELMKDDDYVPMKAREIAMIMRVPKNEYNEFLEILGELELEFKIQKNRKNRYKIVLEKTNKNLQNINLIRSGKMNLVRIKNRTKQTVNNSIERHPVPILGIDYKVKIIYKNIKKAVHFLLSSNVGEILTVFTAMVFGWSTPLLPIHLLWINFITDSLPAIALGLDVPEEDVMTI